MTQPAKIARFVLAAGLCLVLAGCAAERAVAPTAPESPVSAPTAPEMVGSRFSSSPEPPGEIDPDGVKFRYELASGSGFGGYYEVDNARSAAHEYALLAFVDYRQVPVSVAGARSLEHRLRLAAGERAWWSLELDPLPAGRHTLTTLLVWDPEEHSMDERFRRASEWGMISANQANLMVGAEDRAPKPVITQETGVLQTGAGSTFEGLRVNASADTLEEWTGAEVDPGEQVTYYVHVGNDSEKTATYSLIVLLDYAQIGLGAASGPTFVKVPGGACLTYRATLTAPSTPGVHELMVVRGVAPFTLIESDQDALMEASGRIPITVR